MTEQFLEWTLSQQNLLIPKDPSLHILCILLGSQCTGNKEKIIIIFWLWLKSVLYMHKHSCKYDSHKQIDTKSMTAGTPCLVNAQIFHQVDWYLTLGWYVSVLLPMKVTWGRFLILNTVYQYLLQLLFTYSHCYKMLSSVSRRPLYTAFQKHSQCKIPTYEPGSRRLFIDAIL